MDRKRPIFLAVVNLYLDSFYSIIYSLRQDLKDG